MNTFLVLKEAYESGKLLAENLGIPCGEDTEEKPDDLIRWGTSKRVRFSPRIKVFNSRLAVQNATNKLESLEIFRATYGIKTPDFSRDYRELTFPMLGRSFSHTQGKDIKLYLQPRDIEAKGRSDYYTELIQKKTEFRMHVVGEDVIKISEKIPTKGYDSVVWNLENGFTFRSPRSSVSYDDMQQAIDSVKALGLDFGAVDLVRDPADYLYTLEVNTAPRLEENTMEAYAEAFNRLMNQ